MRSRFLLGLASGALLLASCSSAAAPAASSTSPITPPSAATPASAAAAPSLAPSAAAQPSAAAPSAAPSVAPSAEASSPPAQPATGNATAIAVGGVGFACALTSAGGVKCWGGNNEGQLGDGSGQDSKVPVDVAGLTSGVTAIAAGFNHACALTSAGGVKCWGGNEQGQLGNGSTRTDPTGRVGPGGVGGTPVDVSGLTSGVTAISAGADFTCAVTSSGGVKCWGYNSDGQVGTGKVDRLKPAVLAPVDVSGLASGVSAIASGANHTCVLKSGGVWCWGQGGLGRLDARADYHLGYVPGAVDGLASGVTGISAGGMSDGSGDTCAIAAGGAKCWGDSRYGSLGNGSNTDSVTPVDVTGLTSGVSAIAVGDTSVCAITTAGGVTCWGNNGYGQLGNGNQAGGPATWVPVGVSALTSGVRALASSGEVTCALMTSGSVKCWGIGYEGPSRGPVDISGL
jgi:alpha-tubulin suppressor-like RCC1 family protein